ncbi:MAG: adenylate/guanylate cyclase domain-containing protein [Reinekea sp.]
MKLPRETYRRIRIQLLIFIVSTMTPLWLYQQGWLQRLEYAVFDARQSQLRADAVIDSRVKVVLIDEFSLSYMASTLGAFPWPRTVYAELIDFFQLVGAKAVLFDLLFTEPEIAAHTGVLSEHDDRLASATAGYAGTVHSMLLSHDIDDASDNTLNRALPDGVAQRFGLSQVQTLHDEVNTYTLPIPALMQATPFVGVVGVDPDDDGIYRRVKPLWEYQGTVFPALSLTPLLMDNQALSFDGEKNLLTLNEKPIPLDDRNRLLVNFYGDMQPISIASVFQTWDKLMSGDLDNLPIDPYEFENTFVYIGSSAIGLDDIKSVTNDAKAPGVFIHASALSNMLSDDVLTPVHFFDIALWTALLTLVSVILAFNVPLFSLKLVLLVSTLFAYWFFTGWQLQHHQQPVSTPPLMGFVLAWTWSFTYLSYTEGASKRRVKRMLSQYVSEAVLDEVMASPDKILHAGVGRSETLSILFSDIRSFTHFSETLPPERVVKLLNTHFSEMANVIFEHNGTLDKFIGDAIMAYWGMPIREERHASLAIKAAMAMKNALHKINQALQSEALPTIEIGIGLNTGRAVLGNIGSDRKLDYTVIGDAVNVASRMEGITKAYGETIVISENTWLAMTTPRPCLLLDFVRVKGKGEPVAVFAPLPDEAEDPESFQTNVQMANLSLRAFAYYQSQEWDIAEKLYQQIDAPKLRALFLSRIQELRHHPPPITWDGVYTFTWK